MEISEEDSQVLASIGILREIEGYLRLVNVPANRSRLSILEESIRVLIRFLKLCSRFIAAPTPQLSTEWHVVLWWNNAHVEVGGSYFVFSFDSLGISDRCLTSDSERVLRLLRQARLMAME